MALGGCPLLRVRRRYRPLGRPRRDDFEHMRTGFVLTGMHERISCESCHVGGVFEGTPRSCETCHAPSGPWEASFKPNDHVPSSNACDDCHITSSWVPARFDHTGITSGCVRCHNGATAEGKIAEPRPQLERLRDLPSHARLEPRDVRPLHRDRELRQLPQRNHRHRQGPEPRSNFRRLRRVPQHAQLVGDEIRPQWCHIQLLELPQRNHRHRQGPHPRPQREHVRGLSHHRVLDRRRRLRPQRHHSHLLQLPQWNHRQRQGPHPRPQREHVRGLSHHRVLDRRRRLRPQRHHSHLLQLPQRNHRQRQGPHPRPQREHVR